MLDRIFIFVLNMSFVGSYVILFVIIARLFLRKAPKIFSYALWAVVLVRLLCPFSFESAIGLLPSNTQPIPQNIVYQDVPQIDTGIRIVDNAVNHILPPVVTPEVSVNPIQIWIFIARCIWLLGIAVIVVYSIVSLIKLRRELIGATPLEKNINIVDHIDSPFVMGFVRPKIYLPSSLTDSERVFIIRHEKTHIKRLDHITRILGFITLSVHWFNPLVWIAFVLSGKDMETSCDESVMKKMNTDIRADYSEALLKFATGKKLIAATPLAFGEGDTKDRVKNVMKYKKPVIWMSAICLILVGVVTVSLMTNYKNNEQDSSSVKLIDDSQGIQVENGSVFKGTNIHSDSAMEIEIHNKWNVYEPGNEETFIPKVTSPILMDDDSIGAAVLLDYADDEKIVFHGYFGIFIYDLKTEKITFNADLTSAIGVNYVQGDNYAEVLISGDGKTVMVYQNDILGNYESIKALYVDMETGKHYFAPYKAFDSLNSDEYRYPIYPFEGATIGKLKYLANEREYLLFDGFKLD